MIDKFVNSHRFLSTFYPCTVSFEGKLYKTVEHAWQASKTLDLKTRELIAMQTPGKARQLGEALTPHDRWDPLATMELLLKQKMDNPFLAPLFEPLKGTKIRFGNTWHDNFLGECSCSKCVALPKQNKLGLLLEKLMREDA